MAGGTWPQLAAATRSEHVYWGVSTTPANTEAFIEALAGRASSAPRASTTFDVNASGSNKIYYARPTHFGAAVFNVGGFVGGFILRATGISVTNTFGLTLSYDLYESVSVGLGATTITVTSAP